MNWHYILDHLAGSRYASANDVRMIFPNYHDALHWLVGFLIGEEFASACVIDACTIAEPQGPAFHEWLVHWAARATLRRALQIQRERIARIAPAYERLERVHTKQPPLSAEDLQLLVEASGVLKSRLDAFCRFVLVMHGLAKESCEEVAGQLGVALTAVERAYGVAFDTLHLT